MNHCILYIFSTHSQYPNCLTYLWSTSVSPGDVFTQYHCGASTRTGQYFLAPSSSSLASTASTPAPTNKTNTTAKTESPPPQTTTEAPTMEGKAICASVIVGAVIGSVALIALIAFGTLFYLRKRRQDRSLWGQIPPRMGPSDGFHSPTASTMHGFNTQSSWAGGESSISPLTPSYYPIIRVPQPFYRRPSLPDQHCLQAITRDGGYAYAMNAPKPLQQGPIEMDTGDMHRAELA